MENPYQSPAPIPPGEYLLGETAPKKPGVLRLLFSALELGLALMMGLTSLTCLRSVVILLLNPDNADIGDLIGAVIGLFFLILCLGLIYFALRPFRGQKMDGPTG